MDIKKTKANAPQKSSFEENKNEEDNSLRMDHKFSMIQ